MLVMETLQQLPFTAEQLEPFAVEVDHEQLSRMLAIQGKVNDGPFRNFPPERVMLTFQGIRTSDGHWRIDITPHWRPASWRIINAEACEQTEVYIYDLADFSFIEQFEQLPMLPPAPDDATR